LGRSAARRDVRLPGRMDEGAGAAGKVPPRLPRRVAGSAVGVDAGAVSGEGGGLHVHGGLRVSRWGPSASPRPRAGRFACSWCSVRVDAAALARGDGGLRLHPPPPPLGSMAPPPSPPARMRVVVFIIRSRGWCRPGQPPPWGSMPAPSPAGTPLLIFIVCPGAGGVPHRPSWPMRLSPRVIPADRRRCRSRRGRGYGCVSLPPFGARGVTPSGRSWS
jgi:hypothetical protein